CSCLKELSSVTHRIRCAGCEDRYVATRHPPAPVAGRELSVAERDNHPVSTLRCTRCARRCVSADLHVLVVERQVGRRQRRSEQKLDQLSCLRVERQRYTRRRIYETVQSKTRWSIDRAART